MNRSREVIYRMLILVLSNRFSRNLLKSRKSKAGVNTDHRDQPGGCSIYVPYMFHICTIYVPYSI